MPEAAHPSTNQTLYVKNVTDKVKKQDVKRALYVLFSTHAVVLDIVVGNTEKMRGQAHVVCKDIPTARHAMIELNGFNFFGKELDITFGKGESAAIARMKGEYKNPMAGAAEVNTTETQRSVFDLHKPTGAPSESLKPGQTAPPNGSLSPGEKRTREMEKDEDHAMEDTAGDEEEDSGEEMQMSDED